MWSPRKAGDDRKAADSAADHQQTKPACLSRATKAVDIITISYKNAYFQKKSAFLVYVSIYCGINIQENNLANPFYPIHDLAL
ncbi:MAG TPA: hypothetical protein DCF33_17065 [Saprospirales bacterium]|nr:hypothetical protein [Saprospirales bacterium]